MIMSPPKSEYEMPPPPHTLPMGGVTLPISPAIPEMYVVPGVVVIERFFSVPLDYYDSSKGTIRLFARQCTSLARQKQMDQLPFMVYLQGGTLLMVNFR